MNDSVTTYVCNENKEHHFTRMTNMEPEKRVKCSQCEGWMYPHEEDEYYGPIDAFVQKTRKFFRGK